MEHYNKFRLTPQDYSLYLIFGLDRYDFVNGLNKHKLKTNLNTLRARFTNSDHEKLEQIETYYNILDDPEREKDYRIFGRHANSVTMIDWNIVENTPLEFNTRSGEMLKTKLGANSISEPSTGEIESDILNKAGRSDESNDVHIDRQDFPMIKIQDHGMRHGKSLAFVTTETGCKISMDILCLINHPIALRDYLDQLWIKSRRRFRHLKRKHPQLFIDSANSIRY